MKAFFIFVMVCMLTVTVWASLDQNVMVGFQYLFQNRWGIATLGDTYFGFTIIYLWIAYKEPSWLSRVSWLILTYCLGTIAVSIYVLMQLHSLPKGASIEQLLLRRKAA